MADWIKVADRPPLRERQAEVTQAAPCSHGCPCRRKGGSEQTAERLDVRRARCITAGFEHGEGRLAPRNGGTAARSWRRQGQDARPGLPGRGQARPAPRLPCSYGTKSEAISYRNNGKRGQGSWHFNLRSSSLEFLGCFLSFARSMDV